MRRARRASSPTSSSIISRSCTICRGSCRSTSSAAAACSRSDAGPAPTWFDSRGMARRSPASTSHRPRSRWRRRISRSRSCRRSLVVADGEALPFGERSFDLVYAHGVVQYTTDDRALVRECRRVLRPGGMAVFQVYNRISWLNALSQVTKVDLEHVDAPMLKKYSIGEFRRPAARLLARPHRARALSGEDPAARRTERHALQHVLRRTVQRAAAIADEALRLASARVL